MSRIVTGRIDKLRGVTLLEMLLALALSALLLGILFAAIGFHLKMVDTRRTDVEQSQLARALLRRIADDIKGTLPFAPVDFSAVSDLASAGASNPTDLAGMDELDPMSGMDDPSLDPNAIADASSANADAIATSVVPPTIPGLYGNQYQLQIDISRLPRIDEYQAMQGAGFAYDRPGDVRTVAYYLDDGTVALRDATESSGLNDAAPILAADGSTPRGLVRRSLNRAVTAYAANTGNTEGLDDAAELIAPEVAALEFRYFDGFNWSTSWDSEQSGGLPVAVEIGLALAQPNAAALDSPSAQGVPLAAAGEGVTVYRLVVRLPAAQPKSDTPPATSTSSSSGNNSSNSNSGANSGSSSGGSSSGGSGSSSGGSGSGSGKSGKTGGGP